MTMLNKIINWGLIILVGLIPLFFLPFTSEFYEFNKNILLIAGSLLLLLVWLLKMILEKKVSFRRTAFGLPILALATAFILSTIFVAPNKWEVFWIPGGTGTILGLTVLYFLITNCHPGEPCHPEFISGSRNKFGMTNGKFGMTNGKFGMTGALLVSATLLALIAVYQFIGVGQAFVPANPPAGEASSPWAFLRLKTWSPAGGLLPLATFLGVALSLVAAEFFNRRKEKRNIMFITIIIVIIIITVGLVLVLYQLVAAKTVLLPYSTSWAIAIEAAKNWQSLLFGVGPTSFLDAFSRFRPVTYNLTNLWNIRFGLSGSYFLHILTTTGIFGLGAFLWLAIKIIKFSISNFQSILNFKFSIFLILLLFLFLPSNFLLLFTFYLLLGLLAVNLPTKEYNEASRILPAVIFTLVLLAAGAALYLTGRAYAAEVYFQRSLKALAKNDGLATYNNQIRAIMFNPYNDNYRIAYSQTNFLLANSLTSKKDLSDQDKQNINNLIQQSIQSAKVAVNLNRNRILNWENLVQIYRSLINFAQGADQWTLAALQQTVSLDPFNPALRLDLGSIFYSLKDYDSAIRWFQTAIDLKPDFANGYYNLAAAYREKKDYQKAYGAMQVVAQLIPGNSEDFQKVKKELEDLKKQLPAEATTSGQLIAPTTTGISGGTGLSKPQPLPSPVVKPPLELPQEASPASK